MLDVDSGRYFKDSKGHVVFLRGINISGFSKTPSFELESVPENEAQKKSKVSFINKPFSLDSAPLHFASLRQAGFNFIRLTVTWESLEHDGPRIYDHEYISFLLQILCCAQRFGFRVLIDPHQDVWSRFTGGSGAPQWTLELAGFDTNNLVSSEAALVSNTSQIYPSMCWSLNYFRLAAATMFTLFFAGEQFAPLCMVENSESDRNVKSKRHIQHELQCCFMDAFCVLAKRIVDTGLSDTCVIGYNVPMNEPSSGYLGVRNLNAFHSMNVFRTGVMPNLYQGMVLGEGIAQSCANYKHLSLISIRKPKNLVLNEHKNRAWQSGRRCIWAEHGVWEFDENGAHKLLKPDYFEKWPCGEYQGLNVDFADHCWTPFVLEFGQRLRSVHPNSVLFLEQEPFCKPTSVFPADASRIVFSPHWYDGITLISKRWLGFNIDLTKAAHQAVSVMDVFLFRFFSFGKIGIQRVFRYSLKYLRELGAERFGNSHPCIIGEIGIPFNLTVKPGKLERIQSRLVDIHMNALESNLLSFCWWNYAPENTFECGDHWNGEDLSVVSKSVDGNWRAHKALARPFISQTAGTPLSIEFDSSRSRFEYKFEFEMNEESDLPLLTIIELPSVHYLMENGTIDADIQVDSSAGTESCSFEVKCNSILDIEQNSLKCLVCHGNLHTEQFSSVENHRICQVYLYCSAQSREKVQVHVNINKK